MPDASTAKGRTVFRRESCGTDDTSARSHPRSESKYGRAVRGLRDQVLRPSRMLGIHTGTNATTRFRGRERRDGGLLYSQGCPCAASPSRFLAACVPSSFRRYDDVGRATWGDLSSRRSPLRRLQADALGSCRPPCRVEGVSSARVGRLTSSPVSRARASFLGDSQTSAVARAQPSQGLWERARSKAYIAIRSEGRWF